MTSVPNIFVEGTSGPTDLHVFFCITDCVPNAIEVASEIRMKFDDQEQVLQLPSIKITKAFLEKGWNCRKTKIDGASGKSVFACIADATWASKAA